MKWNHYNDCSTKVFQVKWFSLIKLFGFDNYLKLLDFHKIKENLIKFSSDHLLKINLGNKLLSDFFPFDVKFTYTKMYQSYFRNMFKILGDKIISLVCTYWQQALTYTGTNPSYYRFSVNCIK